TRRWCAPGASARTGPADRHRRRFRPRCRGHPEPCGAWTPVPVSRAGPAARGADPGRGRASPDPSRSGRDPSRLRPPSCGGSRRAPLCGPCDPARRVQRVARCPVMVTATMERTTIGVVDDDAAVRRGLERLLGACGYHVETYESAREFLDHSGMNTADCILLDVRMPGMSGVDLHRRLTRDRYQLPTIFISAHAGPAVAGGPPQPAPPLLMKPFHEDALLSAIHDALPEPPIVRPRSR